MRKDSRPLLTCSTGLMTGLRVQASARSTVPCPRVSPLLLNLRIRPFLPWIYTLYFHEFHFESEFYFERINQDVLQCEASSHRDNSGTVMRNSADNSAKTLFRGDSAGASPSSAVIGVLQAGVMMVHCAGCERPILDRFLLNVLDRAWHAKCVQCCECNCNLTEKCFSRDGKLYCKMDFFRRFGTKCAGCLQGISPNDLVRKARSKVFHLNCFTCMVCNKQLSTGEELYVIDENKFVCKEDYLTSGTIKEVSLNSVSSCTDRSLSPDLVDPIQDDIKETDNSTSSDKETTTSRTKSRVPGQKGAVRGQPSRPSSSRLSRPPSWRRRNPRATYESSSRRRRA
ncbi:hypothetical protein WMY93_021247 [Mugilogobius chulae]|uniref:LIM zinc-binding domain-containing protein n=1 Tax=Mugilogobius chulae TaxID=88201 RepID=A0AAW0NKM3_9GOBI